MPTKTQKPFILVDGSSYLFRAYHALPPLSNSKGQPLGAVYGVVNMLRKLLSDYSPEHVAVVFDAKGKTFRHDLYKPYKANRPTMPEELQVQIKPLHDTVKAMGFPLLIVEGVEADDVIGTLARRATDKGIPTLISTSDKDMAQLVDANVTLINTMTNHAMDKQGVEEKFGVTPEQIIDYLTLVGDSVDNIPGVVGVGPKTASKLLKEYGDLNGVIANADKLKGKLGENVRAAISNLPLFKSLVTIKDDVDLAENPENLNLKQPNKEKLHALFSEFEFKKWLAEVEEDKKPVGKKHYHTITDEKTFQQWLTKLKKAKIFSFDTETTSLDAINAEIVGVSFCLKAGEAVYIPLAHDYENAPKQLSRDVVLQNLKPILEDKQKKIIVQNLKYDYKVLANYGINLSTSGFDTMLESYVLNSTGSRHDMDSLAQKYLDHQTIHYEDVAGKGTKQIPFNQVDIEQAAPYAAEDADITLQLHETLWPQLQKEKNLLRIFSELEMPLIEVLANMERAGVLIDTDRLNKQSKTLKKQLDILEEKAFKVAGHTFNLNSPKQLQEILYQKLKLPVIKKTSTGQPSTAEPVLQTLALDYPLPEIILQYRSLSKLKSTYTDVLPQQVNAKTGRVHTSYHQAVTATGRLSSSMPNLQNIPVRTKEGQQIRAAFIVPKGFKMLSADYSQIELRIMAHLSQDAGLLKAFEDDVDVHKATAAEVFSTPLEKVTKDQRRSAKAINFGLIYGMSAFGLSKQLGVDRASAQAYIDLYFQRYPGVKKYMENTVELARKQGYVETLMGRRLYLPEINTKNVMRQKAAERTAINAPLQGSAADIIKKAMICVDQWLKKTKLNARMLLQVHDELVFEVEKKDVDQLKKGLLNCMTRDVGIGVPILVDVGVGDNWQEAH